MTTTVPKLISKQKINCNTTISIKWLPSLLEPKSNMLRKERKARDIFFHSKTNKKTKQTIKILTKKNLDTITETHDIITETHTFYKNLYTAQQTEPHKQTISEHTDPNTYATRPRLLRRSHHRTRTTNSAKDNGKQQIPWTRWTIN